MKNSRKAHLTLITEERVGPSEFALCGRPLAGESRRETPRTVVEPEGNECNGCRIASGHLKKPDRAKPTEEQKRMIVYYRRLTKQVGLMRQLGLTPETIADILRNVSPPGS